VLLPYGIHQFMNQMQCKFFCSCFVFLLKYFLNIRNQVTPQDTLIYLIVKITVIISEPVSMEVVLRKRIAVTISKTEGWWTGKTLKNLLGYVRIIFFVLIIKEKFCLFNRKLLNEQVLFMKLYQIFQKIFMKLKIRIKLILKILQTILLKNIFNMLQLLIHFFYLIN